MRISHLAPTALFLAALLPAAASAQTTTAPKLDESLQETVARGCVGTQSVIIRTAPGYRAGTRAALEAHGDVVTGEFAGLDALTATVHCDDLASLAGFGSTRSVSANAPVGVQAVDPVDQLHDAQAAVAAARAAEAAVSQAQARVTAAQRLTGAAKLTAVKVATAALAAAQAALLAAQQALSAAKTAAIGAQGALLTAQNTLGAAQAALDTAQQVLAAREREGRSAQRLKRRFFATMAVRIRSQSDQEFDTTIGDEGTALVALLGAPGASAQSIGVAVVDSGIEPGLDFDGRLTHFYDFTQGDIRATAPHDGYGHGTHMAGLVASKFVGVAPDARLIGLQVLNDKGQGTSDNVIRAIEFAIANKTLLGIDVLNLSLGHPIFEPAATDPLVQAVEHAVRAGLVVVLSAGNFGINPQTGQPGYAGIASPGNAPSAIAVGATRTFNTVVRTDDRMAPYSSRGPSWYDGFAKPDLVAPGDDLLSVAAAGSTLRLAQEKRGNTGDYMRLSGTSMAAGVTSGVVAHVLAANRGLTPNALKRK